MCYINIKYVELNWNCVQQAKGEWAKIEWDSMQPSNNNYTTFTTRGKTADTAYGVSIYHCYAGLLHDITRYHELD